MLEISKKYNINLDFLKRYKKNNWLYRDVLKRNLKLDTITVNKLLEDLVEQGYLKREYELICPKCQNPYGLLDLTEECDFYNCEVCFTAIDVEENVVDIYRIMRCFE